MVEEKDYLIRRYSYQTWHDDTIRISAQYVETAINLYRIYVKRWYDIYTVDSQPFYVKEVGGIHFFHEYIPVVLDSNTITYKRKSG